MKITTNLTPRENTTSKFTDVEDIKNMLKRAPVINEEAEVAQYEITENKGKRLLVIDLINNGKKGKIEWEL